jgi:hypothetical protein
MLVVEAVAINSPFVYQQIAEKATPGRVSLHRRRCAASRLAGCGETTGE